MSRLKIPYPVDADSYKNSHFMFINPDIVNLNDYIESRGCERDWDEIVVFGMQAFLKDQMPTKDDPITMEDVNIAKSLADHQGIPFNYDGWKYIVEHHKGIPPLRIEAVDEGTVMPTNNVIYQVTATDDKCAWMVGHFEDKLLRAAWYPITVASLSYKIYKDIMHYMYLTCDNLDKLPVMLNDFGLRGVSSLESAWLGGAAHNAVFAGTDNLPALYALSKYYNVDLKGDRKFSLSVPATEHMVHGSWGPDKELASIEFAIDQAIDGGFPIVSIVSDTWDIYHACKEIYGNALRTKIEEGKICVTVRPDSGDPVEMVIAVLNILAHEFGYTYNHKIFKVLPSYIRIIQGDGINEDSILAIMQAMYDNKYSLDNIVFGMGGALLQKVDRDTLKFAMKANAGKLKDGTWQDIYKDPISDRGKKSKKGVLALVAHEGKISTIRKEDLNGRENLLKIVWENGKQYQDLYFGDIQDKIHAHARKSLENE